jgi:hypothetical protein
LPDLAWGALIGLVGAILGALIAGVTSYKIAKIQIQARHDEINLQLSYQEKESYRNRIIESRKDVLLRLRNATSEWVECSHQQTNMNVRLKKAFKNKGESPEKELEIKKYIDVSQHGERILSQFQVLRGQLSDSTLDNFIEALWEKQSAIKTARIPLLEFFNNPKEADINTILSATQREESLRNELRKELLKINKRIEELLSGEPSD